MSFGGLMGEGLSHQESMNTTLVKPGGGGVNTYFLFNQYRLKARTIQYLIKEMTSGNFFILGDATNGILGTSKLGISVSFTTTQTINVADTFTDGGKRVIADWFSGDTTIRPTHIAIGAGSSTYTTSQTALDIPFGSRRAMMFTTSGSTITGSIYFNNFHYPVGSNVAEIGVFSAVSAGSMYSRRPLTTVFAFNTGSLYEFSWKAEFTDDTLGKGIFTDTGTRRFRDYMSGSSVNILSNLALGSGTGSPATTDTTLQGELTRLAYAVKKRSGNETTIYETVLPGGSAVGSTIQKSGLFNASSGGDLFAESDFVPLVKTNFFQLQVIDMIKIV